MSQNTSLSSNPVVPDGWTASTYLNPYVKTYADLAHRIKVKLGYPDIDITVSDEAIAVNINESIEIYSRYAGFDQEFIIFKDSMLNESCEVQLDKIVDSCYSCRFDGDEASLCSSFGEIKWEDVLTSTDVSERYLGSGYGFLNNSTFEKVTPAPALNVEETTETINKLVIKYDPDRPWDFDVKPSTSVDVTPLSSYPAPEMISTPLAGWIKIENGVGEIYPKNWEGKDPCMHDWNWWGLSGDNPTWSPSSATHVIINGVPFGTVGGIQPLELNTGKGATFMVCNGSSTDGSYMDASITFVNEYQLPSEFIRKYNVLESNGFQLELENGVCKAPNTPKDIGVGLEFYQSLSAFGYTSVSSFEFDTNFNDPSLGGQQRKITNVFSADPAGNEAGQTLFNFEYAFAQGLLGYDGLGNRFYHTGYDLVSYDIGRQYIETVKKLLGHSSISLQFNKRTQKLRIYNNYAAHTSGRSAYILGVWIERRIEDIIQEQWVLDYSTALTKITLGNTLTRFNGATAVGGITINGNDILTQGMTEKEELLLWIRESNSEGGINIPFYME